MPYLTYRFRLYPTPSQSRVMAAAQETLRHVYNMALGYCRDYYREYGKNPKRGSLYRVFAPLRNLQKADLRAGGDGPHWLANIHSHALRDTLIRVEVAFDHFFRRLREKAKRAGFPRFKGARRFASIPFNTYPDGAGLRARGGEPTAEDARASRHGYRLHVYGAGGVRIVVHRDVVGKIRTVHVKRDVDGKWYAILAVLQDETTASPNGGAVVGIDMGVRHFLTTSDGERVPNPHFMGRELKRLRRLQRSAARKQQAAKKAKRTLGECRNLQKTYRKVSALHVRVHNLRKEHHHQLACQMTRRFGVIVAEKLAVANLTRGGRLSRAIQDVGWSGFLDMLRHKAARAGAQFIQVDPRGTSQTCPGCQGEVKKLLRERTHRCPHCGLVEDRDVAAAKVILQRGVPGGGSPPAEGNVAQQGERSPRSRSPKGGRRATLRRI